MTLRVLIALAGMALLPVSAARAQGPGRLTFRARVSELGLQTGSYAKSKRPDDCAEVALPGRLNQPPLSVALVDRKAADWSTPERAMASIRSANTAGDAAWILENFSPDAQAGVRSLLAEPATAQRNRDYYKTIQKLEITGSVELRGYTLLLSREERGGGEARVVPVTLTKTAAGWKQTNALSADETFDVVWAAVRSGGVRGGTLGACP
jgi:hypothetical protein